MSRERSFWGWGWADKFPDLEGRHVLAGQIGAMLGTEALEPRAPPRLDALALPDAAVAVPPSLAAFCSAAASARVSHTWGKGYRDLVRGFAGDFSAAPDFVARPRREEDLERVLEWCSRQGVAAIPFGGGTSVVSGVERPARDGRFAAAVSLDLRALDRVLEVDPVSRAARIQAGALGPVLESQLAGHGLTLRHFPQSFEFSTLGGWIATRAGGHFATLYTHIDDLVESVRMITPRGHWESRRLPASGAGPSADRLVLGSEGILGVITEAWMRVQPRPRHRASASVFFAAFAQAADAARAIAQAGLFPANCRLLDPEEARMNLVAGDGSAVLILGFESADHPLEPWIARALALAAAHGGRCPDGPVFRDDGAQTGGTGAAASWRASFLEAPYLQTALVSLGVIADTFETACTWDRFPALHQAVGAAVREAIRRASNGASEGILACRLTHVYPDGPAPYYTFVAPSRAGAELEHWAAIKRAASDAVAASGGTITHHHAVGRLHRPWYDRERPPLFAEALRAAKAAVDPAGILNPGVLID
jgi:alkyldihydroxyacetonephosphate synthase